MLQHRWARHPPEFLLSGWLLAPSTDVLLGILPLPPLLTLTRFEIVQRGFDQPADRSSTGGVAVNQSLVKLADEGRGQCDRDASGLGVGRPLHATIIAPAEDDPGERPRRSVDALRPRTRWPSADDLDLDVE